MVLLGEMGKIKEALNHQKEESGLGSHSVGLREIRTSSEGLGRS